MASKTPLIDPADAQALARAEHSDPFSVLGAHRQGRGTVIRALVPGAETVEALDADGKVLCALEACGDDLFAGRTTRRPGAYTLRAANAGGDWTIVDPYRFGPVMGELDEHLIGEGSHHDLWKVLGAHVMTHEGSGGTHFAVWAPNARRVSVVGSFNDWDGRRHPMRPRGTTGVWEIFLPGVGAGATYKYEIKAQDGALMLKADPLAFGAEHPPATASVVRDIDGYEWSDGAWMSRRGAAQAKDAPVSIYEVHLGSWRRVASEGGRPLTYRELAEQLPAYVEDMGFTHVELLPITEFPFDGSWGYQPVGLYAPTCRFGTPEDFRAMIEAFHARGIGVILDWVPGHFPTDAHGLGRFDGTALYEHADPREGFHQDWNTLIYNYGRREVANYLVSNALYWVREHHLDGLRVDAVASMLYRDYSRKDGEWTPNVHGGRENLEAIAFLKAMNAAVYAEAEGVMTAAEESTAWPGVSRPVHLGGLGFGYKWNMGWMHDTLQYIARDPIHRRHHHHEMTFGLIYAFSENFILPISHDEVVHGKGSLLDKMPGQGDEKFANLRAYLGYMWTHPGKKLLFMGCEFAQGREWGHGRELDWDLCERPQHGGIQALVRDLNRVYREIPALHVLDCEASGFEWVEGNDAENSVFAWLRKGGPDDPPALVVCNMTPVERSGYRVGVPGGAFWREALNTDAPIYGGGGRGNLGGVASEPISWHGRERSLTLTLPPLSVLVFVQEE